MTAIPDLLARSNVRFTSILLKNSLIAVRCADSLLLVQEIRR